MIRECALYKRGKTPYLLSLIQYVNEHPEVQGVQKGLGGAPSGARNGRAVLTENAVRQIRSEFDSGQTTKKGLSRRFGVSWFCVHLVVLHRTWKHVQQ